MQNEQTDDFARMRLKVRKLYKQACFYTHPGGSWHALLVPGKPFCHHCAQLALRKNKICLFISTIYVNFVLFHKIIHEHFEQSNTNYSWVYKNIQKMIVIDVQTDKQIEQLTKWLIEHSTKNAGHGKSVPGTGNSKCPGPAGTQEKSCKNSPDHYHYP